MPSVEATLQLSGLEVLEPFRGECPRCGLAVLALDVAGVEVVVDVAEVLEAFPCPSCLQVANRGHERSECDRCGKTGWIGEPLPLRGVAVDYDAGRARLFTGTRHEGEAVYVFHSCG